MIDRLLLTDRLRIRAQAYASDADSVQNEHLDAAVDEALELVSDETAAAITLDIAYYRWLMLVERNGLDEGQTKAYKHALSLVKSPAIAGQSCRVKNRTNPYL